MKAHHKPECLVKILDCCVQGQGHSECSKYQLMFVRMTSLHGWNVCNQMFGNAALQEQSVMQKGGFAVFKVRVPVNVQSAGVFTVFWIADPFASILSLMVHHYKSIILPCKVSWLLFSKVHHYKSIISPCKVPWLLFSKVHHYKSIILPCKVPWLLFSKV